MQQIENLESLQNLFNQLNCYFYLKEEKVCAENGYRATGRSDGQKAY